MIIIIIILIIRTGHPGIKILDHLRSLQASDSELV